MKLPVLLRFFVDATSVPSNQNSPTLIVSHKFKLRAIPIRI